MRVSASCLVASVAAALALNTSCSAVQRGDIVLRPRVGQGDPTRPGAPTGRGAESDTTPIGATVPPQGTVVRRVCRAQGWSRDWIATAYENASGECPLAGGSDSTAYAAIIVRIDTQPLGTTLDICADQVAPRGWEYARLDDADVSHRCPGAGRDGASAIRRIRRVN